MKLLYSYFLLILFSGKCTQQHSASLLQEPQVTSIMYEASTRGFYEKVWVTKDSVFFSDDRELKDVIATKYLSNDWDSLVNLVDNIDFKELPNLKVPTSMHQVDRAPMATLSVEVGNEIYQTNVFDHGYPPKPIAQLVNKLLSMKEMVAKH